MVGVDVLLDQLEVLMRHDVWGSVYAFMVDTVDSSVVIHLRLKPSAEVSTAITQGMNNNNNNNNNNNDCSRSRSRSRGRMVQWIARQTVVPFVVQ